MWNKLQRPTDYKSIEKLYSVNIMVNESNWCAKTKKIAWAFGNLEERFSYRKVYDLISVFYEK
jgi:hypothetical protein